MQAAGERQPLPFLPVVARRAKAWPRELLFARRHLPCARLTEIGWDAAEGQAGAAARGPVSLAQSLIFFEPNSRLIWIIQRVSVRLSTMPYNASECL